MEQMEFKPDGYAAAKRIIREKLNETACNFIVIGYWLKQVRDSGAYERDGYRNMEEFALAEYGLSAGTASRLMGINTEFSKDGNSAEIKSEYRNFAYSKLQEMLTVTPDDRELVTEKTTVQQIKDIKEMERGERRAAEEERQKNLPLVRMAAPGGGSPEPEKAQPGSADPLEGILAAFWGERENAGLYGRAAAGMLTPEAAAGEICPSGSRLYRKGTDMLFFYDFGRGLKLRSHACGKPVITAYSYREFLERTAAAGAAPRQEAEENRTEPGKTAAGPQEAEKTGGTEAEPVIDAEYRELGSGGRERKEGVQQAGHTDAEIKNALDYFETEHARMTGLGQDTPERRHYKIALECIRKCHRSLAEELDREILGMGK